MSVLQLLQIPLGSAPSLDQEPWREVVSKLKSADGVVATLWAAQHENNKVGGIAATWKSLEVQKVWSESAEGKAFKDDITRLTPASDGTFTEDIILLPEDPAATFTAKVVEVVWWIHPISQISDAKKEKVQSAFKEFQKDFGSQTDGGLVAGWGQKEFDHQGVPSRRFYCLIGWTSVETHLACKQTDIFAENIHWLREHGHVGVGMVHYPFRAI